MFAPHHSHPNPPNSPPCTSHWVGGGSLLGIEVCAVVLVGYAGRAKGAGTSPMKRTWMEVSSERAWKRLASKPSNRGDASPDASQHSTIHTFRRCLAVCCCFVAATDSPFSGSPPLLAARPSGTTVARYVTYSAGHTACHHSHLMVLCWSTSRTSKALHTVRVALRIGAAVALRGQ